jgi:competence protein ComEA
MTTVKPNKYWTPVIIILLAIIVIGGIVAWSKYRGSQPIEISLPPSQELQSEIYIGGAVNNPGFYSLKAGDSIEALIQAAGGIIDTADLNRFKLYIPHQGEEQQPQKIDLNRAEAWLLQALPGIGEIHAKAIIDYRQQNKRFQSIDELTKVEGIGVTTYERIKNLITVAD